MPARAADEINIQKSGEIRLIIDGENYHLRRPKVGELRELEEAVDQLAEQERDERAKAKAEARTARSYTPEILAWWRSVIVLLAKKSDALPDDDDDLPSWLANPTLLGDLRVAWRTVPWGPGGRPTNQ